MITRNHLNLLQRWTNNFGSFCRKVNRKLSCKIMCWSSPVVYGMVT